MSDMYFENLPSTTTPLTAENLDKLNDIKVSTTQPNTGEKVWFKSGKNLLDKNLILNGTSSIQYVPIKVNKNKDYTLSTNSGSSSVANVFLSTTDSGVSTANNGAMINSPRTINSGSNDVMYVGYRNDLSSYWFQLEQGSSATSYEAYVEKEIYIKNNNNVYENFINLNKIDLAVQLKGILNNNTDLNNVSTTGIYSTGNRTLTNTPVSDYQWGLLVVINQGLIIQQYYIRPSGGMFYVREYSGDPSRWLRWRPLNQDKQWTIATRNSTAFSEGSIKYFKNGKVVTVSIMDLRADSDITTHGTIIASGLPIPIEAVVFCLDRYTPDSSASSNCRVSINTSGNLILHYDHFYSGEKQYYGQVTYLSS